MAQVANIDYLWQRCCQYFGKDLKYMSSPNYQVLTVATVLSFANMLDDAYYYNTEPDFTSQLNNDNKYLVADVTFVDQVLNCVNSCARSCHSCTGVCISCQGCSNCTGACSGCKGCTGKCEGQCNTQKGACYCTGCRGTGSCGRTCTGCSGCGSCSSCSGCSPCNTCNACGGCQATCNSQCTATCQQTCGGLCVGQDVGAVPSIK